MFSLLFLLLAGSCIACRGDLVLNATMAMRAQEHDDMVIRSLPTNRSTFAQPILAFHGVVPLDEKPLDELLTKVGTNYSNSDFEIVILVRILFFTAKTSMADYYNNLILPVLQTENYWYTDEVGQVNDDTINSENHMILWMSSSWLLQEREQWDLKDANLRQRLVHFLNIKIKYGYYEFLSITYAPFTFGALLNLVDFCQDTEIQNLADRAIRRLVADYLLIVNDKGISFSAAGRDYALRFIDAPHTQMIDGIVYLLTGLGQKQSYINGFCSFLSTSSIDLSAEVAQWQSSVNTVHKYGHTLEESFEVNAALPKYDRIVFQFSQGAYTHPLTIGDAVDFIKHFGPIRFNSKIALDGSLMPLPSLTPPLAKLFKRLTYGSVLSGHSIHVYRQAGSMLTSVENFWPGLVGGQTFPWMAVADVLPIWTESRLVGQDWLEMKAPLGNTHLPNVVQQDNFALIVYKPFKPMPLALFGDVALYWPPESDFDEVRSLESDGKDDRLLTVVAGAFWNWMNGSSSGQNGSWLLGRKGDSYVAIFRPCGEKKEKGWYACSGVSGRQVWASIVGDSIRYGSFEAFAEAVQVSTVTEVYRWRWLGKPVYETSLTVDGKTIRHHW